MDGVVTILDLVHHERVKQIWDRLKNLCQFPMNHTNPIPHFSWHIADSYPEEQLASILSEVCATTHPFNAQTTGLGVFSGPIPVVYIAIAKSRRLLEFHEYLWSRLQPIAVGNYPYYSPENWMPHITLVYPMPGSAIQIPWHDKLSVGCFLEALVFEKFEWTLTVDNLALIGENQNSQGDECMRYEFQL
jgi:2'-5' RNA ligase